jgi:hypothetical protein
MSVLKYLHPSCPSCSLSMLSMTGADHPFYPISSVTSLHSSQPVSGVYDRYIWQLTNLILKLKVPTQVQPSNTFGMWRRISRSKSLSCGIPGKKLRLLDLPQTSTRQIMSIGWRTPLWDLLKASFAGIWIIMVLNISRDFWFLHGTWEYSGVRKWVASSLMS